jgi:hypothetical protein
MIADQDLASFSRIPLKSSTVTSFSSAQMHLAMLHSSKECLHEFSIPQKKQVLPCAIFLW